MIAESFLKGISKKISHGTLTPRQKRRLIGLVESQPCHLKATLSLIRAAWSDEGVGFQPWTTYYQEALERSDGCWDSRRVACLFEIGAELYGYDEETDELSVDAMYKAFDRHPTWLRLHAYINLGFRFLMDDKDQLIRLVEQLVSMSGNDESLKSHYQGLLFQRLAGVYDDKGYAERALAQFQAALDGSLERDHPRSAVSARIQIQKLQEGA